MPEETSLGVVLGVDSPTWHPCFRPFSLVWKEPAAESIGKLRFCASHSILRMTLKTSCPLHGQPCTDFPSFSILFSIQPDQRVVQLYDPSHLPHVSRLRWKCVAAHFVHESSLPCPPIPYNRRGYLHPLVAPLNSTIGAFNFAYPPTIDLHPSTQQ